jgi:hypothetical protein
VPLDGAQDFLSMTNGVGIRSLLPARLLPSVQSPVWPVPSPPAPPSPGSPGVVPRSHWQAASRSSAVVSAVAASGAGRGFVSSPCPAGLGPSSFPSAYSSDSGSGSWASLAVASGLGLPSSCSPSGSWPLPTLRARSLSLGAREAEGETSAGVSRTIRTYFSVVLANTVLLAFIWLSDPDSPGVLDSAGELPAILALSSESGSVWSGGLRLVPASPALFGR